MRNRREKGIALAIALIVLLLISIMIAGLAWLLMGDQKLGGNNADRQRSFYGAEAGLESLTASLENAFNAKYALTAGDITALTQTPPSNVPGIQYIAPGGSNGSGSKKRENCRTRGISEPVGNEKPSVSAWLSACRSILYARAWRARTSSSARGRTMSGRC